MEHLDLGACRDAIGIGVAGNFAGHLEQAGEAVDFARVVASADAPKGIFPWYVPGSETFLGTFPVASDRLIVPGGEEVNLQIEPEVGALCDLAYDEDGMVTAVTPRRVGAFNDCSIRRPGATKISHKKNWGPASKGMASTVFAVDDIEPDGGFATLRLASFLRRDGVTSAYGVDSAARDYSYAGARLLDWLVDRLRNQLGSDDTPLEPVGRYACDAGRPATALIGIGATRYTDLGESTYLRAGDESIVVLYDGAVVPRDRVADAVGDGRELELPSASVLTQLVVPAERRPAEPRHS